jgi:hypothetical protein
MKLSYFKIAAVSTIIAALIFVSVMRSYPSASAASSSDFAGANTAIENAYTSVYYTEVQNHGDISNLVNQLNNATQFLNKAYEENSTNPNQATIDLQTAVTIALKVSNSTSAVSSAGIKVHELQTYESFGAAVTVVSAAGLIYAFSDSIYRNWWARTYRNHIVKLKNKNVK